jgi:nitrite reductase/ring-hydroxylating ferredoxin subunit
MSVDGAEMTAGNDSKWHALAMLNDVGPGQMLAREVYEVHLAIYNVGGEVFATDNVCTHAYALLTVAGSMTTSSNARCMVVNSMSAPARLF